MEEVDKCVKQMAASVKAPKRNWVVYNETTKEYLGVVPNREAENYPLPGESETVFEWVTDLQKAKANWIIKPPVFILKHMHGINFDDCTIRRVNIVNNVITPE